MFKYMMEIFGLFFANVEHQWNFLAVSATVQFFFFFFLNL